MRYLIILLAAFVGCESPYPVPRTAEGPGGYLDDEENIRRNINQTGKDDVQIPDVYK